MSLEPVPTIPGLWRDREWRRNMPGVYALVVGASAYPHLGGGADPAEETYQLEQLISSASTALRVFEWLRTDYRRDGLPLVWCELLLAPTDAERGAPGFPRHDHYAEPTESRFRAAIQRWTGSLPAALAASASRTLFFFSGHGVQSNSEALLLPSDYLNPSLGAPQFEGCISARELRRWMEGNPVAEHLALIDACRNEFSPLASKGATAHGAFPVNPPGAAAPRTVAFLSSASPNTVAFQVAGRRTTFFGQALLEGLAGRGATLPLALEFLGLVDYVRPRVNQLLRELRAILEQTARPSIEGDYRLVVTEVAAEPLAFESFVEPDPTPDVIAEQFAEALDARFDRALAVETAVPLDMLALSRARALELFGPTCVAELWSGGVSLHTLANGEPSPTGVGADIVRVDRNSEGTLVRVDLALAPASHGLLLVFAGPSVLRERIGIPLPTDAGAKVPIRLTLTMVRSGSADKLGLHSVEARLGPSPHNPHHHYMWQLTREAELSSLAHAATRADPARLKDAVEAKLGNPTAAVAGALMLAQARALAMLDDWPRNLMEWFPNCPDGAILWAEALRDALGRGIGRPFGVEEPRAEMVRALQVMASRGLPFFADSFELAESLTRWLSRASLSTDQRVVVDRVEEMLRRGAEVAASCGHFMVLTGRPRPGFMGPSDAALTVEEMLGILRGGTVWMTSSN